MSNEIRLFNRDELLDDFGDLKKCFRCGEPSENVHWEGDACLRCVEATEKEGDDE